MIDVVAAFFMIVGALLALVAGIALVRFPELFSRMHAATKPQTLGLICIMIGISLRMQTLAVTLTALIVIIFQLVTSPVASHMVGRAANRIGIIDSDLLTRNDLE